MRSKELDHMCVDFRMRFAQGVVITAGQFNQCCVWPGSSGLGIPFAPGARGGTIPAPFGTGTLASRLLLGREPPRPSGLSEQVTRRLRSCGPSSFGASYSESPDQRPDSGATGSRRYDTEDLDAFQQERPCLRGQQLRLGTLDAIVRGQSEADVPFAVVGWLAVVTHGYGR